MIILQSNSDSLEILLAGAVATTELPFYASWAEYQGGKPTKSGESASITAGTTVVKAVSYNGLNTSRSIQYLSIHNSDTAPATVTVRINTGASQRILCKYVLAVGDSLQYADGTGFTSVNSAGETKVSIGGTITATNLSIVNKTATTLDIASSTGNDATVPEATITEAGLLNATDKVKLNNTSGTNTGDQTLASLGIKHQRITTGSVGAGSTALVTITWAVAFSDANYTVNASVIDSTTSSLSLSVVHVESKSASAVEVRVLNNAAGSLTGEVQAIAIHD